MQAGATKDWSVPSPRSAPWKPNAELVPASSIPRDHIPIITTAPAKLIECEPAIFKWEGGEGPFEAFALGKLSSGDWQWDAIRNVGNESFAWVVNYPQHTEVAINIFVRRSHPPSGLGA